MSFREAEIPILDVSALHSHSGEGHQDIQILRNGIKEACLEWGCFRVVNHGVEEELIQSMDAACRDLFNLPEEVKERAVSLHVFDGYSAGNSFSLCERINFPAVLTSNSIQQYADKLWPQGNPNFCNILGTYSSKLGNLTNSIIKLILEGLGLQTVNKHFQSNFVKCQGNLQLNYYSLRGESNGVISLKEHKDLGVIAILYEDQSSGLQIQSKQGQWYNAKPLDSSFLVIIGNALKIWSNDRCWSVEHRVIFKGSKPRLSAILFWSFPLELEVYAPEELIDDEHPRIYKPFIFKEYREAMAREYNNIV